MKIAYIAHKMSGDVAGNTAAILSIMGRIRTMYPDVVPIAPYLPMFHYLDNDKPEDRELGMAVNKRLFSQRAFDELWVCSALSPGVEEEIRWAKIFSIPIRIAVELGGKV